MCLTTPKFTKRKVTWVVDSGATIHCVNDLSRHALLVFAAIRIAENLGVTSKTKHFSDAIHYIRDQVDRLVVQLTFVKTQFQLADGFTKPLGKGPFRVWRDMLHLRQ